MHAGIADAEHISQTVEPFEAVAPLLSASSTSVELFKLFQLAQRRVVHIIKLMPFYRAANAIVSAEFKVTKSSVRLFRHVSLGEARRHSDGNAPELRHEQRDL